MNEVINTLHISDEEMATATQKYSEHAKIIELFLTLKKISRNKLILDLLTASGFKIILADWEFTENDGSTTIKRCPVLAMTGKGLLEFVTEDIAHYFTDDKTLTELALELFKKTEMNKTKLEEKFWSEIRHIVDNAPKL